MRQLRMSEDSMMSIETNHPPLTRDKIPYNKQFVLYSKNLLPQLQPILLFITEQAEIPTKHYTKPKETESRPENIQSVEGGQQQAQQPLTQSIPMPLAPIELDVKSPSLPTSIKLSTRYPIYKLLKAISRIFLLNQIELIFFSKVLALTQWNINQDVILKVSHLLYPFIAYDPTIKQQSYYNNEQKQRLRAANSQREAEFKKLCLYIMLTAYSAKYYFMEKGQTQSYLKQAQRYMKDFDFVFKKWLVSYRNIREILSPKVFNQTHMKVVEMSDKDQLSHNLCIDLILQLSPAYTNKERY